MADTNALKKTTEITIRNPNTNKKTVWTDDEEDVQTIIDALFFFLDSKNDQKRYFLKKGLHEHPVIEKHETDIQRTKRTLKNIEQNAKLF